VGNGLGSAGVSIDGAAVKGINAMPLSEVRSVLPVLDNPANIDKASTLTPKQFHYAFTNAQDDAVAQHAYDRYSAPTPAKVLFQGGFAAVTPQAATTFDFADDDRAPLLFQQLLLSCPRQVAQWVVTRTIRKRAWRVSIRS
jgi:hypothetical protein